MQSSGSFRLIVRRGPQPNQVYELNKDVVAIGRDITNDIVINDPEISRHHSRMTRTAGGYVLEDVGSTNGSFVNGQRLNGARPLNSGDLISLGETVTLGYETTVSAEPGNMQTVMTPQVAPYNPAPAYPQQIAPPTPSYSPQNQPVQSQLPNQPPNYGGYQQQTPGSQPAGYGGYQEQYGQVPPQGGAGLSRWLFVGCGCLLMLCILSVVIALFVIDQSNGWCTTPVVRNIVDLIFDSCTNV